MATSRQCKFYRNLEALGMGRQLGYCDLDCGHATCDGDIDFCQEPISLRTYFFEQVKREGGLAWEIRRKSIHFSGDRKM